MRKGLPAVLTCLHRGFYLGVAQLVERLFWEQEAMGSSPATQTMRVHIPLCRQPASHRRRNLQTQFGFVQ